MVATYRNARRHVPGIGYALAYLDDPLAYLQFVHRTAGPVARVGHRSGSEVYFALGPDATEVVLRNADKAFANGWQSIIGPFFDRGLMLLDFAEHHQHRRILQHAFTRDRIVGYTAALSEAVAAALDGWRPDVEFRAYPATKQLTLELATRIFMGGTRFAGPAELARVNTAFVDCVQAGGALVRKDLPGTRWRRALAGRRVLEEFLHRHLPAARAGTGDDLFSVLCRLRDEDGSQLDDRDIVNHMIFLLMAAHDTSTITVTTAVQYLGQHPDWQQRCRAESAGLPVHASLAQLESHESLSLVVKECLRLVAPVPVVARRTVADTVVLGQRIPAGAQVMLGLLLSHHLPDLWTDPQRFDPDRFGASRREDRSHRYAWEPFGGGVHKCLGMAFADAEVKTILHQLLGRFEWSVEPDYRPPMNNVSLPFPKDGLPVRLRQLTPTG